MRRVGEVDRAVVLAAEAPFAEADEAAHPAVTGLELLFVFGCLDDAAARARVPVHAHPFESEPGGHARVAPDVLRDVGGDPVETHAVDA